MSAGVVERANPLREVQRQFHGFWPFVRGLYSRAYGHFDDWPGGLQPLEVEGHKVGLDPRTRQLQIEKNGSKIRTNLNFSRSDDEVAGITVSEPGRVSFVADRVLREQVYQIPDYPSYQFVWSSSGKLREVRVHVDSNIGFEYDDFDQKSKAPWARVFVSKRGTQINSVEPAMLMLFPDSLRNYGIIYGVDIPWEINTAEKVEEVISRSGIRDFPVGGSFPKS